MKLLDLIHKEERFVVGLISGTSMDGVDSVLVRLKGSGLNTKVELIEFICLPYESRLRGKIEDAISNASSSEISELNFLVGETFAQAALSVVAEAGLLPVDLDLIGSHGQTIFHNPPSYEKGFPSTMQIGELDVIAERTGITTVGDFRTRDIAAGGEGAPLVPYLDFLLFRKEGEVRIAQNIGGIANATVVTENLENVIAFDNGPGNMLMDKVIILASDGKEKYDIDGKLADRGTVDKKLLDRLLSEPYFSKMPPKSTGGELFGDEKATRLYASVSRGEISLNDLMTTLLELTVESIALSYERFIFPKWEVSEMILSGGGSENPVLVQRLKTRLNSLKLSISDEYEIPSEAKEAVAFAVLANELISGNPGNLPSVTGAKRRVPLGKIVLGSI